MDAETPATQPIPRESPIETNPIRQHPMQDSPPANVVSKPARPKGPNAAAVVLGLAALVLAGLIIASETMSLRVDWSQLGPGAIVGIGLVLVVLGAIGLIRRHDEA
jgi:hypothetical protein